MGLSTKQVSGDGLEWTQSLLQELPKPQPVARRQAAAHTAEQLACPRCGSTNTKFCYYNNYNKSQPRHFCKACKRHWTKGGTLRNIPVGGGRKNKRHKTATTATATAATRMTATNRSNINNSHAGIDQGQALILPPSSSSSSSQHESLMSNVNNNGRFLGTTTLPLLQSPISVPFTFSSSLLGSFESNPCSIATSFQPLDAYSFAGLGLSNSVVDATTTTTTTTTTLASQPWQVSDIPSYWNWDDINSLVSTHELNMPWDDTEIKP